MKLILSALFVVALAASATQASSVAFGYRNASDYLLFRETVVRNPVYNTYVSVTVDFPKSGQTNTKTITAIYAWDNFKNNSGATAALWSGGPSYRFASVNLKSPYSKGINSTIEIYGK